MLLFRLSGVLLFRYADRQFLALLFQLPPRIIRFEARSDAFDLTAQNLHGLSAELAVAAALCDFFERKSIGHLED